MQYNDQVLQTALHCRVWFRADILRCSVQSFSSLLWAFSRMGVSPLAPYLDRASEVMERREREGLQVGCSSLTTGMPISWAIC